MTDNLYYDNTTNEWKKFVMPVETEKEVLDLSSYFDQVAISRVKEMCEGSEPTPSLLNEAAQIFKNANSFTRARIYRVYCAHRTWLLAIHPMVGMLFVETVNNNTDPLFEKYMSGKYTIIG